MRFARDTGVNINHLKYPDKVVNEVCDYYSVHGIVKTKKRFPKIKVRSIVERYYGDRPKRQIRWTEDQLIEAVKMAGLVNYKAQAKIFNRPNSGAGSIKSLWVKVFSGANSEINGLKHETAKWLVDIKRCPVVVIKPLNPRIRKRDLKRNQIYKLYLWCDMENHLNPLIPDYFRSAIKTMAEFQRKIFGVSLPQQKIRHLINRNAHL